MINVLKSKKRIAAAFLLSLILLFISIESYAADQNKEIFIGQFKGDVSVVWCGNDALVVSEREHGIDWIDILSRKTIKISLRTFPNNYDYPLNCTPDGKWVVYTDGESGRIDKGYRPPKDSGDVDWDGGVIDLYRYEVSTAKKQKFAVMRYLGPFNAVSPDGTKIFLGAKHNSAMPMPDPKWDAVWLKKYDWGQMHAKWFLDSSGVVIYDNNPNRVGIEFFGKNGWAKMFELTQFRGNIAVVGVDRENRFYLSDDDIWKGQKSLYMCAIKNKNLSCKKVIERDRGSISYKVMPSGNIVFVEAGDTCIRRLKVGQAEAKCIVEKGGDHEFIGIEGISPDGKLLAFVKRKVGRAPKGGSFVSQSDLFVINLEN